MGERIYKNITLCLKCLLDILFPKESACGACGRILKEWTKLCICTSCLSRISFNRKSIKTMEEFRNINNNIQCMEEAFNFSLSVCEYEGLARDMVHRLKYKDNRNGALTMAAMIMECMSSNNIFGDIVIPVPIHKKRLKKRGYNQAELIACELANLMNLPYLNPVVRIKDTPSQVLFNGTDRWYNVKDAFLCPDEIRGKAVVLVDDVITTGATAYYCACALRAAGASEVIPVSFARAD